MKLDQTFIAIRERSPLELLDLTLQVLREHFVNLITLLLINAAPWIALDLCLVGFLGFGEQASDALPQFIWLMTLMVISQAQVGTYAITIYLGNAMFVAQPTLKQTLFELRRVPMFYWYVHGLMRLVFPVLFVVLLGWTVAERSIGSANMILLPLMVMWILLIRTIRPFATEIILLEKTSRRKSNEGPRSEASTAGSANAATSNNRLSFTKRSINLHNNLNTDQGSLLFFSTLLFAPLTLIFYAMFCLFDQSLLLSTVGDRTWYPVYWTAALWLTAGFATILRFLRYIDTRIKQEGWALELKMRAEGKRLQLQEGR